MPLSSVAVNVLSDLRRDTSGFVMSVKYFSLDASFRRGLRRAGLIDVRIHDLGRKAITPLAEKLPNVIELAAVSGHKSLMVLKGYDRPAPSELAKKLG